MHQSSSESSIDKNKFPSVINLYASDNDQSKYEPYSEDYNSSFGNLSVLTDENRFEMKKLYTIEEQNLSNFQISGSESSSEKVDVKIKRVHSDSDSNSSIEESGQDRISTTSTSTSSEEGLLAKTKTKPKSQSQLFKNKNELEHQSLYKKQILDDVRSLRTQPNCPSSPSMWSSSTSGKFANIFSKRVSIRGSYSHDNSQFRYSGVNFRTGMGSISHGFRLNSQAADSGISNTSPDTLSSTEFYQRNIEDSRIVSKCDRLTTNLAWTGINIPPSILKHRRRQNQGLEFSLSNFRTLIYHLLSITYIFLLSTIILVLSISEQRNVPGSKVILESFQVVQYTMSILFLMIFHLSDCKGQPKRFPLSTFTNHQYQDINPEHCLILSNPVSFEMQEKIHKNSTEIRGFTENIVSDEVLNIDGWTRSGQLNESSRALFESLFKISILVVGIISMFRNGIELATQIEIEQTNVGRLEECYSILIIVRSFLSLLFTIIQTYFVFLNFKNTVSKITHRIMFGMVHMTSTNMNTFLQNVISTRGTMNIIRQRENIFSRPDLQATYTTTDINVGFQMGKNESICIGADVMGQISTVSDVYLYPFSIQYSALTIAINLLLLSSLDCMMDINLPIQSNNSFKSLRETSSDTVRLRSSHCKTLKSINCKNSNKGFFIGLFSLLISIISLILLYIFSKRSSMKLIGMKISYLTELFLTFISTLTTVLSLYDIRDISLLPYPPTTNKIEFTNRIMMFISLFGGVYLYNVSSILAWRTAMSVPSAPFVMISSMCNIIHGTLQTVYILLMIAKISVTDPISVKKPKKEYISFIIMNNIGLWCLKLFMELQQNTVENIPELIYGHIGWILIKRISIPLTLLYQLESVMSLAVIWKIM